MTPDLNLLSGFARGVFLSLHVRDTCLHSGSWLLSGLEPPPIFSRGPQSIPIRVTADLRL